MDPNLDLPSPEVSEQQARSFCVRVLRKIAVRLSGGNRYWQEVDVSLAVETGEYPDYALHIRALQEDIDDVDDEIAPETYCVELMHNEPVFAASDEVLVSSLQNQWEPDEDQLYDEDFDEGEEEGEFEIVGHMRVTEKIFFSVLKRARAAMY